MSEYTVCESEMSDGACVKEALTEMGYAFEEHKNPQHLYGYQGDKREQVAHIIVRRAPVGSYANDVGFVKNADGKYSMIISEFDKISGKQSVNFTKNLKVVYNKYKALKEAKKHGFRIIKSQKVEENGRIRIRLIGH